MSYSLLAFLGSIGPMEIGLLLVLGVLLFGRKLPDIGRSVGKTFVSFKEGLNGIESDVTEPVGRRHESQSLKPPQRVTSSSHEPKFEDVPGAVVPPAV